MAYQSTSKKSGQNVTKWKKDKLGNFYYTMWLRQSRKEGVFKWTTKRYARKGGKWVSHYETYFLDTNTTPQNIDGKIFYPIKVIGYKTEAAPW